MEARRVVLWGGLVCVMAAFAVWWWGSGVVEPTEPAVSPTVGAVPRAPMEGKQASPRSEPQPLDVAAEVVQRLKETDTSLCSDLEAVAERVLSGEEVGESMRACLDRRITADDQTEDVLRLLAIYEWNVDRTAWAQTTLKLAAISGDANLHAKLALHYGKKKEYEAALHHATLPLEEGTADPSQIKRLTSMAERLCGLVEHPADSTFCAGVER